MNEPIRPMLAVSAEPFDSPQHLFEVKWDGVRAMASIKDGQWQLWGRELADYRHRYPELELLGNLPSGTVVDGELTMLREGRADFGGILRRHQLVGAQKIRHASHVCPASYILFDVLYHSGRPLLDHPLSVRRAVLREMIEGLPTNPRLFFSEGLVGSGRAFFEMAVAQGHEGVMAKHLESRYLPGRRSTAWRKIKPVGLIPCVIMGYTPARSGLGSLLVAAPRENGLRYVGQLVSGFTKEHKAQLAPMLVRRVRRQPVVACPRKATWVEPDLFCLVQFLSWTPGGRLRGACFRGLLAEPREP